MKIVVNIDVSKTDDGKYKFELQITDAATHDILVEAEQVFDTKAEADDIARTTAAHFGVQLPASLSQQ